jgi:HECT-domain (ubiquitin-transferase)
VHVQAAVGDGEDSNSNSNSSSSNRYADAHLPRAHTCFFSINLPKYSCDSVMAERLRYAIYNCIEMDADFRLADTEQSGWGDISEVHTAANSLELSA